MNDSGDDAPWQEEEVDAVGAIPMREVGCVTLLGKFVGLRFSTESVFNGRREGECMFCDPTRGVERAKVLR